MSDRRRTHYTAEQKVAILREHLLDHVPVSDLCERYRLQPTVFYRWQKQLFENGALAFTGSPRSRASDSDTKIAALEEKLIRKNEVLSELMEEHLRLKKELGER